VSAPSQRRAWIAAALVVLLAYAAGPLLFSQPHLAQPLIAALVIAGIAVPWAMLSTLGGLVSFGHAVFFGVGAYASGLLALRAGWSPLFSIPAAGLITVVASVAVLPALRLRGAYFALGIFAYAAVFRILVAEAEWLTGGPAGLMSIPRLPRLALGPVTLDLSSKVGNYWVILTLVVASILVYSMLRRSVYGLALLAMGESEDATRVIGVPSTWLKAGVFILSGLFTGMAGGFNAHFINFLEPDYAFSGYWSVLPVVAALFGGSRTLAGPAVGAVVIYLLDQLLFKSLLPHGHEIVFGVLLVTAILTSPDGLLPLVAARLRHALAR